MRVGLDLDGVCYEWDAAANAALAAAFPRLAGLRPHEYWGHLDDQVGELVGAAEKSGVLRWLWTEGVSEMFGAGHAYPGAPSFMRALARDHELVVITSRPRTAAHLTLRFLARHRVNAAEVHVIGSGKEKSQVPACDAYVEDRDKNVDDLVLNTMGHVFVPRRPWNAAAFEPGGSLAGFEGDYITRYNEFSEVLTGLSRLGGGVA